ncbi:hypothetical protein [Halobacteriovorax sp. HLS]|uniref:hypothetical protein n=1 Tax=Halobacteriovorax sp. HLS TaxID=2234000 RepID=UPI000FD811A5|nr:hypothetical protein [Halobacteriovorax sp. HLS]
MKLFILLLITVNLVSCSVKSDGEETSQEVSRTDGISASSDSDGDLMNDKEEVDLGRNPLIADLPDIRVRFLQNYKITVHYKDLASEEEGDFVIDTKVGANDPSFKYRVGNVFLRENSYKTAASIGKFADHSWGDYREHDLSWVKYPDIDQKFFQENVMRYSKYFDADKFEITNVQIELENSIKLKANTDYKEISNPEVSFRFYNYESENFEVIHSEKIERTIVSGVNETLTVKLENVNPKLVSENYFKKGEFIISEMTNYEIPKIESDYMTLITSVKSKTVPVVYNTPLETEVRYVSTGSGVKVNNVLEILFGKKYVVENEKITAINQFQNNLPQYTYLSELRDHDKKGSWFVFTNRLNKHYLQHDFTNKDVLSLSYILGKDLASQVEEKVFSYREEVETTDHYQSYILGNIQPNSEVSFFLESKRLFGEKIKHWTDIFRNRGCGGRRNCVSFPFRCDVSFNIFESLETGLSFSKELNGEISRIELSINGELFNLVQLINEKKVRLTWSDLGVSINVKNINAIKEISNTDENVLSLKLNALRESHFNGVKLTNMSGKAYYQCPSIVTNVAGHNKWPLSVESQKFNEWAGTVRWDLVQRGNRKNLIQMFSVGITSVISNFHN